MNIDLLNERLDISTYALTEVVFSLLQHLQFIHSGFAVDDDTT